MSQQSASLDEVVRTSQIIAGALIAGVVMFAVIGVVAFGALSDDPSGMIVSLVGAVFAVMSIVMHRVVPSAIVRPVRSRGRSATSADELPGMYRTKLIIGLAILEGAAFFNIVAAIVEHNWWSLGIAGVLVFWMLTAFPTRTRIEHWIETQQLLSP
ncbi:MAG: hypothetical protein DWQ34_09900 [Planctomycetota bacterium]|nr:MAG: hypothetical protein DWQ34_09900 [Planctomycetota bacterium]REK21146.1 MAG: hypothetical protein DWQ41_22290 [Planctomycetota bacterium]REK29554.1 MAG: hypothetical protein DWQ45_22325 [Planctomycetota bacterium]